MTQTRSRFAVLSGNTLKIIAAVSMLIDHVGFIFFPGTQIFRILGRLALPIFAFMIAEGCRYTRNKLKYFLSIFILAAICQIVYFLYDGDTDMCVLVTFSLSILLIYTLQFFKGKLFADDTSLFTKILSALPFILLSAAVYFLNMFVIIDYGFFGCFLPVFASAFHKPVNCSTTIFEKIDRIPVHVITLGIGILLLALYYGGIQYFMLFAVPLLLLYSGKRGKKKMKYFFYIFYPTHLAALQGLYMLIEILKGA